jgi:hypothetical protein
MASCVQDYSVILDPVHINRKEASRPVRPAGARGRLVCKIKDDFYPRLCFIKYFVTQMNLL